VPIWYRLQQMTGLVQASLPHAVLALFTLVIVAVVALGLVLPMLPRGGRGGSSPQGSYSGKFRVPALDLFAAGGALAVVVLFLLPSQFHYHFSAFLTPFLAAAVGLAIATIVAAVWPGDREAAAAGSWRAVTASLSGMLALGVAVLGLLLTFVMGRWEQTAPFPNMPTAQLKVIDRVVPSGACMVTDDASVTIMANRFVSDVPGCPLLVDSIGTDYGLADGRDPQTGAAKFPALVAVWHNEFAHAQYVWLSGREAHRMPWTPALMAFFHAHFTPVVTYLDGTLYRRTAQ
jgi:hypothetical protein